LETVFFDEEIPAPSKHSSTSSSTSSSWRIYTVHGRSVALSCPSAPPSDWPASPPLAETVNLASCACGGARCEPLDAVCQI